MKENHPKIYFEGKKRTLEEMESILCDASEEIDIDDKRLKEIFDCIDCLSNEYEYVKIGITHNGDDQFYTSSKRVLKKDINFEVEDMKQFYAVNF